MDRKFWDSLFESYNSDVFDVLKSDKTKIIKKWMSEIRKTDITVADVGCGVGKWLPYLSDRYKKVVAVDFSEPYLEHCRQEFKSLKNISYLNINMTKTQKKLKGMDLILCVNSILSNKAPERDTYFRNLKFALKNNGHLVLVVPSIESVLLSEYVYQAYKIKEGNIKSANQSAASESKEFWYFKQGVVNLENNAFTKHYLKEELISLLSRNGFMVEKIGKVEYSWDTQIEHAPKSLRDPYPWDWIVLAKKKK